MLNTTLIISLIVGIILGKFIYEINEIILKTKNNVYEKNLNKNVVELTQAEYDELCEKGWKSNVEIK